jgi:hypothetical protein
MYFFKNGISKKPLLNIWLSDFFQNVHATGLRRFGFLRRIKNYGLGKIGGNRGGDTGKLWFLENLYVSKRDRENVYS